MKNLIFIQISDLLSDAIHKNLDCILRTFTASEREGIQLCSLRYLAS